MKRRLQFIFLLLAASAFANVPEPRFVSPNAPLVSGGQWLTHNYYHADGNGNITALESSAETLTANYRYDPFGNTLSQSGGLATANSYRFSSKEFQANSGLYYYGYRFYSPNLQRWLNRDPIHEEGGINLYRLAENSAVNYIDPFGFDCWVVESEGGYGHQMFIGQNSDGTYWSTELMPQDKGGIRTPNWEWIPDMFQNVPLACKANDTSPKYSPYDPNNLPKEVKIVKHVKCSKEVDEKTKKHVEDTAKENTKWDVLGNNCKDYANNLTYFVLAAKLREQIEKQKAESVQKKQTKPK